MPHVDRYERLAAPRLSEALDDSPVALVHGPRQCGKTTLAQYVGTERGFGYVTFDDETARRAAAEDPAGYADGLPEKVVLDEVQRVPELFAALKAAVDRRRTPGRFILAGSTNVLLLPKLADSLAGRMAIVRLHPFAQAEVARTTPRFLDRLFSAGFPTRTAPRLADELADRVVGGGFPSALARPSGRRRAAWYGDYVETLVQRDVRDLARIASLDALPRLLAAAAAQSAQLFNAAELGSSFQLSRPTVRDYLTLLERVFLIDLLPPWHSNRLSRLVKTPKLHLGDSGLAAALLGADRDALRADRRLFGHLLETFVLQELRRLASGEDQPTSFFHFREKDGLEVDVVLDRGARGLAGVEVKASATVGPDDFRGLRKLKTAAGTKFRNGVVLYDGETCAPFGDGMFAVPIRFLWEDRA